MVASYVAQFIGKNEWYHITVRWCGVEDIVTVYNMDYEYLCSIPYYVGTCTKY